MPGRLELIKKRRGYASANQGHSPTQGGGAYGRAKPSLHQTAQPKPRSSVSRKTIRTRMPKMKCTFRNSCFFTLTDFA
jgi:cytoskeletal protein RodZ